MNDSINQSINQSINYKGVCRTAPATPGLLKVLGFIQCGQVKEIVLFFLQKSNVSRQNYIYTQK